ncbi:hypothetical protein L6452_05607 [Arctium lappa]|uniref:Uncharacterized protein n=1 Tax=Arctium lappa TaxID=4217 RepID=A0ACB9EHC0_ARCLA|nr:hypothetical protein L6452_05607 [Arctium lappa]
MEKVINVKDGVCTTRRRSMSLFVLSLGLGVWKAYYPLFFFHRGFAPPALPFPSLILSSILLSNSSKIHLPLVFYSQFFRIGIV